MSDLYRKIFRSLEGAFATCQVPCKGEKWEEAIELGSMETFPQWVIWINRRHSQSWRVIPEEPMGYREGCPPRLGVGLLGVSLQEAQSWLVLLKLRDLETWVHITWHIFFLKIFILINFLYWFFFWAGWLLCLMLCGILVPHQDQTHVLCSGSTVTGSLTIR